MSSNGEGESREGEPMEIDEVFIDDVEEAYVPRVEMWHAERIHQRRQRSSQVLFPD